MTRSRWLVLVIIVLTFASGCLGRSMALSVPPSNFPIEDVLDTNLKHFDLTRVSKTKITEISGIDFPQGAVGYDIKYRYPDQPITVIVVRMTNNESSQRFWSKWTAALRAADRDLPRPGKLADSGVFWSYRKQTTSVFAWEKNGWFTLISIPTAIPDADELKNKVRDVISSEYASFKE